jgi:hypothetical protein
VKTNIGISVKGHITITDVTDGNNPVILVDKDNAINYENISLAISSALSDRGIGSIYEMSFGNGGATIDSTGLITYLPPNTTGTQASLYNQTYSKIVDDNLISNLDPTRNKMSVSHTSGKTYSDILVQCLLDYGEPSGQYAFDNATNSDSDFVFDELGLKVYDGTDGKGNISTKLISHVIFHPVQKALNRQIQVDYTIRVQAITNLVTV